MPIRKLSPREVVGGRYLVMPASPHHEQLRKRPPGPKDNARTEDADPAKPQGEGTKL